VPLGWAEWLRWTGADFNCRRMVREEPNGCVLGTSASVFTGIDVPAVAQYNKRYKMHRPSDFQAVVVHGEAAWSATFRQSGGRVGRQRRVSTPALRPTASVRRKERR